jgi:hypothetical protein
MEAQSELLAVTRSVSSAMVFDGLFADRSINCRAGYVATGFWAGITFGRAISTPLNNFVGEKRVIFLYLGLAICLEVCRQSGSVSRRRYNLMCTIECSSSSLYSSPSGSLVISSETRSPSPS